MTLREMLERRSKMVEEMRAITNSPAGEAGDLSAEQSTRFDSLKTELAGIERKIERQQLLDEAERRMQGTPIAGQDNRFEEACRAFSLRAAIAGAAGLNVEWSRERELSAELAKRAGRPFQGVAIPLSVFHQRIEKRTVMTSEPVAGPGSNLIATDLMGSQFIDTLRSKLVVRKLGARVLSGLTGNVDIPKQTGAATAGWVAEDTGLSLSDPTFSKIQLQPKHAGCLTEFSRNMLLQSSPDIEQLIRSDFAAVLARAVDSVAINGGGANEPDGILQTSGLDVTTAMGSAPTWADVLSLIELVELGLSESSAFLTHPSVVRKLRSTAKVSSTDSVMIMQSPAMLADYPLASTTLVPINTTPTPDTYKLIFGNFADVLLGYWSELDILVNPYESSAYAKGNVQVRGMLTCDVAIRHIESFAACTDIEV